MSQKLIRAALESRLATWAAARTPALSVAYENDDFTPEVGTPYLRAYMMPADTDSQDLEGSHRLYLGVYQVSMRLPALIGTELSGTIVGELETLFPVNLRLTSGAITVTTTSPVSAGPGQNEPGLYVVPVSFSYRADVI